jgi:wobble nucleotide-excising tRNase
MLIRLLHVRNVGRLDFGTAADLAQFTVVYAENGRGKTTLTAVLRSLSTGDAAPILQRRHVKAQNPCTAGLVLAAQPKNRQLTFDGKAWNSALSDIEIFDSTFVSENVYSGSEIDPDHRRNLHKFVIGASNVSLAHAVDKFDDDIRVATHRIGTAEESARTFCANGLSLDGFLKLADIEDIAKRITEQESVVAAARASQVLEATQVFRPLPAVDHGRKDADVVLAREPDAGDAEAQATVDAHVQSHLGDGGRKWLSDGVHLSKSTDCPFCAHPTGDNPLVEAITAVFSKDHRDFERIITIAERAVSERLSANALHDVRAALQHNALLAPAWKEHGVVVPATIDLAPVESALVEVGSAYQRSFEEKRRSPSTPLSAPSGLEGARSVLDAFTKAIIEYNSQVAAANASADNVKATARTVGLQDALAQLALLKNTLSRYTPAAVAAVAALEAARSDKKTLEEGKKQARDQLDAETEKLFASYQAAINTHLHNSGCGYSISGTKTVYPGGKPRVDYQLVIDNTAVHLAKPSDPLSPSFKTALSDGDRSTLAFAFFLARLDLDPQIGNKIVVIDDPMTSLDAHRRDYTKERIAAIGKRCKQLILLTHDAGFAKLAWDSLPKPKASLTLADAGGGSQPIAWDIVRETQADYFERFRVIREFAETTAGDPARVAFSLRVLLEGNLRMRFPDEFPEGEWLGDFTRRLKASKPGDSLHGLFPKLQELEDLKDFSKQFHHDQNPLAATVKPAEAALQAYCNRVLSFTRGT